MINDHNNLVIEQIKLACCGGGPECPLIDRLRSTGDTYSFHGWEKHEDRVFVWFGHKGDAEWFEQYDLQGNVMRGYTCGLEDGAEMEDFESFVAGRPLRAGFSCIHDDA